MRVPPKRTTPARGSAARSSGSPPDAWCSASRRRWCWRSWGRAPRPSPATGSAASGGLWPGVAPPLALALREPVTQPFTGYALAGLGSGWLFLAPIDAERASYSPLLFFAVAVLLVGAAWLAGGAVSPPA